MAFLADLFVVVRDACISGLRDTGNDPEHEEVSIQNCWSWTLKKWLIYGGKMIISQSPRARVLRCEWLDKDGRLWHFEPLKPKSGIRAIWHAYLHRGRPKRMR